MIDIIVKILIGYAVTHYSLATFWENRLAIMVIAAIVGVLYALL